MPSVTVIKTFEHLGDRDRLIVAGMYLNNKTVLFVDRKNSSLIVTNTDDCSFQDIDLAQLLPEQYHKGPENRPNPSDVNKGFKENQLLITYTGIDFSLAIACELKIQAGMLKLDPPLQIVKINDRTRSVVAVDEDNVCATTEYYVIVKNKNDNNDANIKSHPRVKRDKGGLLMTDRKGNFYYGDGPCFVGCFWDGANIVEKFRFTDERMKFPRGSAIEPKSGRIFICTDSSRAIFSISKDGTDGNIERRDGTKQYGDIDFNPDGNRFFTTFWLDNEWPILHKLKA